LQSHQKTSVLQCNGQERTGHCGYAAFAGLFKYIYREIEAFLKISILFKDIQREIEAFPIMCGI
jgi:hypothetical protein